jgi:23S rRNA (uridine2552-2'-O)-methyltransferase
MKNIKSVEMIKGDITKEEETINAITETLDEIGKKNHVVDVVISDAAPKFSGNKSYDHFRSFELSKSTLNIASSLLREGGNFITKIFQGDSYEDFYKNVKGRFKYTRAYSPEASRKSSAEVYVIGEYFLLHKHGMG